MDSQQKALYLLDLLIELIKNGFPPKTAINFIKENYSDFLTLIQESHKSETK